MTVSETTVRAFDNRTRVSLIEEIMALRAQRYKVSRAIRAAATGYNEAQSNLEHAESLIKESMVNQARKGWTV